jgi:hypothetical protein
MLARSTIWRRADALVFGRACAGRRGDGTSLETGKTYGTNNRVQEKPNLE